MIESFIGLTWGDFSWEIVAARNVWAKKVWVLLILMFLIGILVRIRSILEDCEMILFCTMCVPDCWIFWLGLPGCGSQLVDEEQLKWPVSGFLGYLSPQVPVLR